DRLGASSVDEEADRADIRRAYQAVLAVHAGLAGPQTARPGDRGSPRVGGAASTGTPAAQASRRWSR
ncbi:MAG TPA: hypothetical protein VMK13_04035, partial [Streptosporangiaceae bacterium]|nr:hypothetical protein [Streptosporangiaceae bacterium]